MRGEWITILDTTTTSVAETIEVARRLGSCLHGGDVVALDGPLGAGKTSFVRGLADGLGVNDAEVSSPTFVLCHEYRGDARGVSLFHLDGYRLHGPDDLETIGWQELLAEPTGVIVVEWAERLGEELPDDHVRVEIGHVAPEERSLRISALPETAERLANATDPVPDADAAPAAGRCPICNKPVRRDSETFPFCQSRCRLIDLGRWLGESYRIGRPLRADDEW